MRKLLWLLAGGAFLVSPAVGHAQIFNTSGQTSVCTTGAFRVCASVTMFVDASTNSIVMRVANLGGDPTVGGFIGEKSTLTAIGFFHSDPADAWEGTLSSFNVSYVTGAGIQDVTDVTSDWTTPATDIKTLSGVDTELSAGTDQGHKGGIVCEDPGPPSANHRETCQDQLFDIQPNYVQFTYTFSQPTVDQFSFNNLQLRFHAQQLGPDGEGSIKCDTTRPPGDEYACEVVPEPITTVLLATGLAGMGGAGYLRRRRRRGQELVDD